MSQSETNLQVLLKSRPVGVPQAEHFELVHSPIGKPTSGQVLIRIAYVSVDPAMRGWVNAAANYAKPVEIGAVMKSFAVGRIVESQHPKWQVGDLVTGLFGWQQWAVVDAGVIDRKLDPEILGEMPLSASLGVLGLNGVTAYFGLLEIGKPRPGQTVVVSSGAGAVGSCVGQIAKLSECRTVAIVGGPDKVALSKERFGYDEAVDYKSPDFLAELRRACPNGVDVYFDNTSGAISDAVTSILNERARVVICGTVAHTDWDPPPLGPRIERKLLVTRSRIEGFIAPDYQDRWDEAYKSLSKWLKDGHIRVVEEVLDGLEKAPDSVAGMYRGENMGKRIIRVAEGV
jgi:NADPH-dependent curcumin reductase CurA